MATLNDSTGLQAQQQAQAAQAAKAAQQAGKVSTKPSVQFSDVLKNQQQGGSQATIRLLKNNPVAGAEVLKSAVTANKSSKVSSPVGTSSSSTAATSSTTSSGLTTDSTSATGTSGTSSSGVDASVAASRQMMEMNQDFNLQYLSLQENMQAESRQYTAMSNVSKTKSDTAKNSLSNVK